MTPAAFANKFSRRSLALGVLIAVSASACTKAPHSENVKEGDADYPVLNPHPAAIINLTVIIPASIKTRLLQGYHTRVTGGLADTGPPCAYIQTLSQTLVHYYIEPELELKRIAADVFSGQIVVDRYLPGQCDWGFTGVWHGFANGDFGNDPTNRAELLRVDGSVPPPVNGRLDVWCKRSKNPPPMLPEPCMGIHGIQLQFPEEVAQSTVDAIVASGGDHGPPNLLVPGTHALLIQFHDLDAVGKDLELRVN